MAALSSRAGHRTPWRPQGHHAIVYDSPPPRRLNGRDPAHSLALGHDGAFYGTTSCGSDDDLGATIFRFTPDGTLMTLYRFDDYDGVGSLPASRLLRGSARRPSLGSTRCASMTLPFAWFADV